MQMDESEALWRKISERMWRHLGALRRLWARVACGSAAAAAAELEVTFHGEAEISSGVTQSFYTTVAEALQHRTANVGLADGEMALEVGRGRGCGSSVM